MVLWKKVHERESLWRRFECEREIEVGYVDRGR